MQRRYSKLVDCIWICPRFNERHNGCRLCGWIPGTRTQYADDRVVEWLLTGFGRGH
jgi:hypothetical protein